MNFAAHMLPKRALALYKEVAEAGMIKEIDGFLRQKAWTGVLRSTLTQKQLKKILRSSMFIKEKFDLARKFLKLEARLVVNGRGEDRTLFKDSDINSSTVSLSSLLTIASVAAAKGLHVVTMDVGSAYLNAEMKEDVYVYLQKEVTSVIHPSHSTWTTRVKY